MAALLAAMVVPNLSGVARADSPPLPGGDTLVALFSEPHESIGGGEQLLFLQPPPADQNLSNVIGVASNETDATRLGLSFPGGAMNLNAPAGQDMTTGMHHIEPIGDGPGWTMNMHYTFSGCPDNDGWVDIRDLAETSGTLQRLSMTFLLYCEGDTPGLSGDIEIGEPASPVLEPAPPSVVFAPRPVGTSSQAQPVTYANTSGSPQTITGVSLTGSSEYAVSGDGCSGVTLAPAGTCSVGVRFTPSAGGTAQASVAVSTSSGARATTALTGSGVTSATGMFITDTLPGGDVVPLASYRWDRGSDFMLGFSAGGGFVRSIVPADPDATVWGGDVDAPTGQTFTAGSTYPLATQADPNGASSDLEPDGTWCPVASGNVQIAQWSTTADPFDPSHIEFVVSYVCANTPGVIKAVVADHATSGVVPPRPTFTTKNARFRRRAPLRAAWSDRSSNIIGYQVESVGLEQGRRLVPWQLRPVSVATRGSFPDLPGGETCVRVRALGLTETPSAWSRRCSVHEVSATAYLPSHGFTSHYFKAAVDHRVARATGRGDKLTLRGATGDRYEVSAIVGPGRGRLAVYSGTRRLGRINLNRHGKPRLVTFTSRRLKPFSGDLYLVVRSRHRLVDIASATVSPF